MTYFWGNEKMIKECKMLVSVVIERFCGLFVLFAVNLDPRNIGFK